MEKSQILSCYENKRRYKNTAVERRHVDLFIAHLDICQITVSNVWQSFRFDLNSYRLNRFLYDKSLYLPSAIWSGARSGYSLIEIFYRINLSIVVTIISSLKITIVVYFFRDISLGIYRSDVIRLRSRWGYAIVCVYAICMTLNKAV